MYMATATVYHKLVYETLNDTDQVRLKQCKLVYHCIHMFNIDSRPQQICGPSSTGFSYHCISCSLMGCGDTNYEQSMIMSTCYMLHATLVAIKLILNSYSSLNAAYLNLYIIFNISFYLTTHDPITWVYRSYILLPKNTT